MGFNKLLIKLNDTLEDIKDAIGLIGSGEGEGGTIDLTNVETELATLNSNIEALNDLSTVETEFGTVNTNLGAVDTSLATLNANLELINTSIGTISVGSSPINYQTTDSLAGPVPDTSELSSIFGEVWDQTAGSLYILLNTDNNSMFIISVGASKYFVTQLDQAALGMS